MNSTRFGPYDLEGLIGKGGMGEVHRARDREHGGRLVAVKLLPEALSSDPQYRARFRREAEHAAGLTDAHVPVIHRYGEVDGRLFLDMEFVPGRELDALLKDGPLLPSLAVELVGQIASALDSAHRAGLVHRDVKPANVLVDESIAGRPMVKLIDFGIATPVDPGSRTALTRTGAVIGTLAYMAPERFLAQPAGPAADIYALACVLFELLTGQRPFPDRGLEVLLAAHVQGTVPRPSERRPGLPGGFDEVVARGMAKDPAARFPRAGALAAAAWTALGTPPVTVPVNGYALVSTPTVVPLVVPLPDPEPAAPPRRRSWFAPAGLGVVVGGLVLVAVLLVGLLVPAGGGDPIVAAPTSTAPAEPAAPAPVVPAAGMIADRTFVGVGGSGITPGTDMLGGRTVLLTTGRGGRVLDMVTGKQLGAAEGGNATVAELGGTPVLLTSELDSVIRIADLATGVPRTTTLAGHTGSVWDIATGVVDGRVVVASSASDKTVRFWDLETGRQRGEPVQADELTLLRFVQIDGRAAVVGASRTSIRVWDAATGAPIGPSLTPTGSFDGMPLGTLGGRVVAATEDNVYAGPGKRRVFTYDVATGAKVAETVLDSADYSSPVGVVEINGRALLLRADGHDVVQYDLATGAPVGDRYTGHEADVGSLTVIMSDGRPYLLTTSSDSSIRVWDMTARNR
ncbi:WD40 repeat domain-containing serine/threonine protein kinase [Pseudonocardia sp. TRM90224]|uniref:WD40 repeat domain-containing serine/threonine protein kinase n=1 Tax=Pseudonocardia sp. TRM90224 TaxID=2812678 RepID=UPI001E3AFA5D|nr:serine/threonine-protein kinase [Pseudonocardia sp. TRM90224]